MRSLLSKKNRWVFAILLLVIAGGSFATYQFFSEREETEDTPAVQTALVRQGDIIIRASGTGTLIIADEILLAFGTIGPVEELYVQVGDLVKEGDLLAIQGEREQLESSVASDQLAVMNAQQVLDELAEQADLMTALALLELANAQDALKDANYTQFVQQEGNRASKSTINAAKASLVLAENELEKAQSEFNKFYGRPADDPGRALALTKLSSAQGKVDSALRALNWYLGQPTDIQQMVLDADVAIAEARLAEAERNYERLRDGPDPEEVSKAELQLQNAEAKRSISIRNLEQSVITAPLDATVMNVSASVGETVAGTLIALADLTQPYVEIFLDETDLDKIAVGFEAEVVFDALPDRTFLGQVVQVDPSLVTIQGVSTIRGLVKLDESSSADLERLPIGLNAAVDVVGGRAEGVPIIPFEALRELEPGEFAVFVMQDGELKLRIVEVGLRDFSFAEILSGLQVGELVTTGIVETQ